MSAPLYVYALVHPGRRALPAIEGVGPGALAAVDAGTVAAVAGPVDVAQFEPPALEHNLADPAWLERVVRAHEEVVEALLGAEPVLPMRFGSIFSDADAVRLMLEENASRLGELLDQVRGRVELGVTVRVDRDRLLRGAAPAADPAATGRDYLRRRQEELRAAEHIGSLTAALVDDIHCALTAAADRAAVLQPRRSDPALALSAAYLVPAAAMESFAARADEVRRNHAGVCSVEVTGPWPPYSFTSIDVSGPGA